MALSTNEAEYLELSSAATEVIWLKRLVKSVGLVSNGVVFLNGDNQTDPQMVKEAKLTKASKNTAI